MVISNHDFNGGDFQWCFPQSGKVNGDISPKTTLNRRRAIIKQR
jgi:hypothetical protein